MYFHWAVVTVLCPPFLPPQEPALSVTVLLLALAVGLPVALAALAVSLTLQLAWSARRVWTGATPVSILAAIKTTVSRGL